MMIPMVVLQVKSRDEGLLSIDQIEGPNDIVEGEEATFTVRCSRTGGGGKAEDLRVELDASVGADRPLNTAPGERDDAGPPSIELLRQVLYVSPNGIPATFHLRFDSEAASPAERQAGSAQRTLTVTVAYNDGRKAHRKSRTHRLTIKLNSERVIRRVGSLGNILGLTPKTMR
jgi:hypothetical protein